MRGHKPYNVPIFGLVDIKLPDSLWARFYTAAQQQGVTVDEAAACLIDALPGLTEGDLFDLEEPRKERRNRSCTWSVGQNRKCAIERFSSENGFSSSSLLRRILYAILITKQIVIINSKFEPGMRLQRIQMHFDFSRDYGRDGPIP